MSRTTIIPLALAASLAFGAAALAQSSGGSSGGASSGAASSGAAGAAGSAAPGGVGSASGTSGSGPAAAPPGSISPSTNDVAAGSAIPRARTGAELGSPQPGGGATGTTGSIGPSTGGSLRQQNNATARSTAACSAAAASARAAKPKARAAPRLPRISEKKQGAAAPRCAAGAQHQPRRRRC